MNEFWLLFALGLGWQIVVMVLTWATGRKIKNFSVVDVVWCYSFPIHAILFAALGSGWMPRKIALVSLVLMWGLRLAFYLTKRTWSRHPKEDPRYLELRAEYGQNFSTRFFWFFQVQALIVSLMTVPFVLVSINPTPEFSPLEIGAALLWLFALAGETLADAQKARFRKNPANSGDFCRVGLWKYSRHPNYFFESLIWWSFYLLAIPSGGWFAIFSPLILLLLLLKVSGIPITERLELKRFGDKFRAYQNSTSAFVPWPPKAGPP